MSWQEQIDTKRSRLTVSVFAGCRYWWALSLPYALAVLLAGSPAPCSPSAAADTNLTKLEVKFFQHDYPKETVEARLERLEKMVFGEARAGSNEERLANLVSAVPNLNSKVSEESEEEPADEPEAEKSWAGAGGSTAGRGPRREQAPPPAGSKYPAVSAIEQRLIGKDYADEPITRRLERLELKVFGKVSDSDDLSERVDRLKQRSGVDIARLAPPGSDWADEDEDFSGVEFGPPVVGSGQDGRLQGGRDPRQDVQKAYGIPPAGNSYSYEDDPYAGTGTYGMSGTGSRAAPRPAPVAEDPGTSPPAVPRPAPDLPRRAAPVPAIGLNQQVAALEAEIFGKTYARDPLPARLNRLETTVFPQERPATDKALPDRVARLISVIPLSDRGRQVAQGGRHRDPDFPDLQDDMGMPQPAPPRATSGLSKIINSISGLLGGGYGTGYMMPGGNLTTDPQTGLLYDTLTGNLIDPVTGAVIGQRVNPGMGGPYGSSFGSGFAPFGAMPYGFGMGSGTGMRFGFGSGSRFGFGMWP